MTLQQPKRKVGRPRKAESADQRGKRRFYMLEKTDQTSELIRSTHESYRNAHGGKDTSDAGVIRWALMQVD